MIYVVVQSWIQLFSGKVIINLNNYMIFWQVTSMILKAREIELLIEGNNNKLFSSFRGESISFSVRKLFKSWINYPLIQKLWSRLRPFHILKPYFVNYKLFLPTTGSFKDYCILWLVDGVREHFNAYSLRGRLRIQNPAQRHPILRKKKENR